PLPLAVHAPPRSRGAVVLVEHDAPRAGLAGLRREARAAALRADAASRAERARHVLGGPDDRVLRVLRADAAVRLHEARRVVGPRLQLHGRIALGAMGRARLVEPDAARDDVAVGVDRSAAAREGYDDSDGQRRAEKPEPPGHTDASGSSPARPI